MGVTRNVFQKLKEKITKKHFAWNEENAQLQCNIIGINMAANSGQFPHGWRNDLSQQRCGSSEEYWE